jgi:hypothetical protein
MDCELEVQALEGEKTLPVMPKFTAMLAAVV